MERIICLAIGYLFGIFQTAYIIGRLNHIDIRDHGSGNAGTTNALRILGKQAGILTYIGDTLKALLAGIVVVFSFRGGDISLELLLLYCGLGVVIGHNFPFYLNFKGGKGIAASAGIIMAFDYRLGLIAMGTFILVVFLTRYVSLGSMIMMIAFLLELILLCTVKILPAGIFRLSTSNKLEICAIGFVLSAMAVYKHKDNIRRLWHHTEPKLGERNLWEKREDNNI